MIKTIFSIYDTEDNGSITKDDFIKFLYNYPGKDLFSLINEIGEGKGNIVKAESTTDSENLYHRTEDKFERMSLCKIDLNSSMLNENGVMNLSNMVETKRKNNSKSTRFNGTLGLTAQPFRTQPTTVNNKIRYIADIIYKRYSKSSKFKLEEFSLWLKLHKNFLNSFREWFRTDIWVEYKDQHTNRDLPAFHKKQPDIEGPIKMQKFKSFRKKKGYMKMYDKFLMLFENQHDTQPIRVIIVKLLDISFNVPKNKIVITHPSKRYRDIKLIAQDKATFQKWRKHFEDFTNTLIYNKYDWKAGEVIGKGKFSTVYKVKEKTSGKMLALKYIEKDKLTDQEQKAIVNEANILSGLNHANICKLFQTIETQRNYFYIFELVNGCDLYKYVTDRNFLDEYEASWIMKNLLDAIECVHLRGIIHRDLKPENIMLEFNGDEIKSVKMIDFGLACFQIDDVAMKTRCGTLNYIAPEILTGEEYTPEVDIFALGVIMYFMVRGSLPFYSDDQNLIARKTVEGEYELDEDEFFYNVSDSCKDLLKGLLAKDPTQRTSLIGALTHRWITEGETLKKYENKNREQFDLNDYL